jgi:hypothetical protein
LHALLSGIQEWMIASGWMLRQAHAPDVFGGQPFRVRRARE